jgi:hypothetical protein
MAYYGDPNGDQPGYGDGDGYPEPPPTEAPPGQKWDPIAGAWVPEDWVRDPTTGEFVDPVVLTPAPPVTPTDPAVPTPPVVPTPTPNPTPSAPSASDWFRQNAPNPSNFGAPASPFGETYTALGRPDWLKGEYVAPKWTEQFNAPDAASLYNDPGYAARLDASQRAQERSAASRGSVLSGGFVGRTLPRAQQELASTEYGNAFKRAYDTYMTRYGAFNDEASRGLAARSVNEQAYTTDANQGFNQYQSRYQAHVSNEEARRRAEEDRWKREYDLARLGLDATLGGR